MIGVLKMQYSTYETIERVVEKIDQRKVVVSL